MKLRNLTAFAVLGGTLILTNQAEAAYTGLSVHFDHSDGAGHDVFRVYANFTSANDFVAIVQGNIASPFQVQSRNSTDTGAGSAFFNGATPLSSNNLAPYDASSGGGTHQHGTFATIGIHQVVGFGSYANSAWSDATGTSPSFPNFITGTSISNNNMGWSTTGATEQGRAGHIDNVTNDTALRVLIMQLSVGTGENVRGTVNVGGFISTGLADNNTPFLSLGQTFNSFGDVPAPGALALLGVAGLVGKRRRRG